MKQQRGFSLIEVMTAMALFGVVTTGMIPVFLAHARFNHDTHRRSSAVAAAQIVMDSLRTQNPAEMPSSGSTVFEDVEVDSTHFVVVAYYCLEANYCSSKTRHVRVEVDYGGKLYFTLDTVYTKLR